MGGNIQLEMDWEIDHKDGRFRELYNFCPLDTGETLELLSVYTFTLYHTPAYGPASVVTFCETIRPPPVRNNKPL